MPPPNWINTPGGSVVGAGDAVADPYQSPESDDLACHPISDKPSDKFQFKQITIKGKKMYAAVNAKGETVYHSPEVKDTIGKRADDMKNPILGKSYNDFVDIPPYLVQAITVTKFVDVTAPPKWFLKLWCLPKLNEAVFLSMLTDERQIVPPWLSGIIKQGNVAIPRHVVPKGVNHSTSKDPSANSSFGPLGRALNVDNELLSSYIKQYVEVDAVVFAHPSSVIPQTTEALKRVMTQSHRGLDAQSTRSLDLEEVQRVLDDAKYVTNSNIITYNLYIDELKEQMLHVAKVEEDQSKARKESEKVDEEMPSSRDNEFPASFAKITQFLEMIMNSTIQSDAQTSLSKVIGLLQDPKSITVSPAPQESVNPFQANSFAIITEVDVDTIAHDDTSPWPPGWSEGDLVLLHSITSRPSLNGAIVKHVLYKTESGRFLVEHKNDPCKLEIDESSGAGSTFSKSSQITSLCIGLNHMFLRRCRPRQSMFSMRMTPILVRRGIVARPRRRRWHI